MAHQPSRPFESLEWYRDAVRNNFRDDDPRRGVSRWVTGVGMLHAHIGVFATGIVLLLLVNLIRSPEDIWSGRWIMAWTVLVLLHTVVIGILWAMRQWNEDAPDEALLMIQDRERGQASAFGWGLAAPTHRDAQDVDFRETAGWHVNGNGAADRPAAAAPDQGWTAWTASEPVEDSPASERASWKEASAAAWLERKRPGSDESRTTDGASDA